ncbi:CCA tRNA nucleotidyltransferase [Bacillus sp. JJ1122]|uniref:CCA tRNA nucleotidyltransferase n=1 Tax=Bacillus sp. JJ1122 TaxID=3122951 RepID=UPI003000F872
MIGNPFLKAVPVLNLIENGGYEAYFVGGSVRDHILCREIADVDIATSALPDELKKIFPKTTDVGIEHGTILVHYKGSPYEITTFRSEAGYSDFRRPDKVLFIRSLTEDLQRRDFTMNAIAMDKDGNIIDPFGGKQSINKKLIETVGNPDERFGEDALRMLRAVRFLSQLSFSIEDNTFKSLQKHCNLLENIAVERKTVEFEKMLLGRDCAKAAELMVESGMYQYLPGLVHQEKSLIQFSARLSSELDLNESWVLLLYELQLNSKEIDAFLRGWKLPVQKIKLLKQLLSLLLYRLGEQWNEESVYKAGLNNALSCERVYRTLFPGKINSTDRIKQIFNSLPIKERHELNVTGNDLMAWHGKNPGPWLKELLEQIEKAVIFGDVQNEKEKIRVWLSNLKSEKN